MKRITQIPMIVFILLMATTVFATPHDFKSITINKPPIRFAILGDRTGGHVDHVYEEIVAEVEEMKPDFVMTVGDQIEGYTEDAATLNKQWDEYFEIVKPLTMPLYITPGNHDITTDAAEPVYFDRVGKPNYTFDVNNYHFIVLDVSRWEKSSELSHQQLQWLIYDLMSHKDAAKTLVFFHKPFWYNTVSLDKPDTLHSLFVNFGVDAVFNGHFHSYFSARHDGIIYTAVGSSGGDTGPLPHDLDFQFTWVTLTDSTIDIAPIKKGAIRKWDMMTDVDLHLVDEIAQMAISFPAPLRLPKDLKVKSAKVQVQLDNITNFSAVDTLRWSSDSNWTITPQTLPVEFKPGQSQVVEFDFSCNGTPFPLPEASIDFPYGENKLAPVATALRATRQAIAVTVSKAPVIDGKLDDACWSNPITHLFSEDESKPVEATLVYFAHDKDNLYIAARCGESKMDSIRDYFNMRDGGVYGEDCFGIFLQPDLKNDTAYQIYFNPIGTIFDQRLDPSGSAYLGDKAWNGKYESKVIKCADGWNVEAKIPLKQFGIMEKSGMQMGINPVRKQKRLNNAAAWQLPRDYNPRTFGVLTLQ